MVWVILALAVLAALGFYFAPVIDKMLAEWRKG